MSYRACGRSIGLVGLLAYTALLGAGCAQLPLQYREIVIPAARLNDGLAKRFAVDKKLLDTFSVRIERPTLTTDVPAQRLRAQFEFALVQPFSRRPLTGRGGISGAIGFDAATYTVTLLEPKIEALHIDSVPPVLNDTVLRLGRAFGAALLSEYPLVSLSEKDLIAFGRPYRVDRFEVLEEAVRVVLRATE